MRKNDPWEGAFWQSECEVLKEELSMPTLEADSFLRFVEKSRARHFYVNCWHLNEVESAAM